MGDVTRVRTGLPRHPIGGFVSAGALGTGFTARPPAVGLAPVRERSASGDFVVTPGAVFGTALQGGVFR